MEGDFDIAFEYICHPSEADCPIDDASRSGTATVSITSADLCPSTVVDVGLSGTLASYEDAGFAIPRAAFTVGQTTHFLAETESSDAEIIATSILTIQHELSGAVTLLYDADTNFSLAGANVVIDAATGNPNTATFSFDIAEALFVVPRFSSDTFTISATLDVDFDGFALLMKRAATETKSNGNSIELLQAPAGGAQPVDSSTQLEIGSNAVDEGAVANNGVVVQETDAANSSLVYVVVGVLAVVGILIIGAVVYLRRSSKKGAQQIAIQPQVQMQQVPQQYITPQQQQQQQVQMQAMQQMQMPVQQMQMQMPAQQQQMPMQQQQMVAMPMQG